jgi:hypothetical protein
VVCGMAAHAAFECKSTDRVCWHFAGFLSGSAVLLVPAYLGNRTCGLYLSVA